MFCFAFLKIKKLTGMVWFFFLFNLNADGFILMKMRSSVTKRKDTDCKLVVVLHHRGFDFGYIYRMYMIFTYIYIWKKKVNE